MPSIEGARWLTGETDALVRAKTEAAAAAETEKMLADLGAVAKSSAVDVSSTEDVAAFFDGILKDTGRIDVLVNNAGIGAIGLGLSHHLEPQLGTLVVGGAHVADVVIEQQAGHRETEADTEQPGHHQGEGGSPQAGAAPPCAGTAARTVHRATRCAAQRGRPRNARACHC